MTRCRRHISQALAQASEVGLRAYSSRMRAAGWGAGADRSKKSMLGMLDKYTEFDLERSSGSQFSPLRACALNVRERTRRASSHGACVGVSVRAADRAWRVTQNDAPMTHISDDLGPPYEFLLNLCTCLERGWAKPNLPNWPRK